MKITLRNTTTGKDETFDPVDAREILNNPDNDTYEASQTTRDILGASVSAATAVGTAVGPNEAGDMQLIPQLQGGDAEMQTGNAVDKYARQQVVKAEPGQPMGARVTAEHPEDTQGRSLRKKKAAAKKSDA